MGAYTISEFGCLGRINRASWLGVTVVAWLLVTLSATSLLLALASTFVARRSERRIESLRGDQTARHAEADVARAGWMASGLFSLVIFVESSPIIYYLRHC
jgi:hypothetical protein